MSSNKRKNVFQKLLSPFEQRSLRNSIKATDTSATSKSAINNTSFTLEDNHNLNKIENIRTSLARLKQDVAEMAVKDIALMDNFIENHERIKQTNYYMALSSTERIRPKSYSANEFSKSTTFLSTSLRINSCYYEPTFDILDIEEIENEFEKNIEIEKFKVRENFISQSLRTYVDKMKIENNFDIQSSNDDADSGTWDEVDGITTVCDDATELVDFKARKCDRGRKQTKQNTKTNKTETIFPTTQNIITDSSAAIFCGPKNLRKNILDERPDSYLFFGSESINIDDVIKVYTISSPSTNQHEASQSDHKVDSEIDKIETSCEQVSLKIDKNDVNNDICTVEISSVGDLTTDDEDEQQFDSTFSNTDITENKKLKQCSEHKKTTPIKIQNIEDNFKSQQKDITYNKEKQRQENNILDKNNNETGSRYKNSTYKSSNFPDKKNFVTTNFPDYNTQAQVRLSDISSNASSEEKRETKDDSTTKQTHTIHKKESIEHISKVKKEELQKPTKNRYEQRKNSIKRRISDVDGNSKGRYTSRRQQVKCLSIKERKELYLQALEKL